MPGFSATIDFQWEEPDPVYTARVLTVQPVMILDTPVQVAIEVSQNSGRERTVAMGATVIGGDGVQVRFAPGDEIATIPANGALKVINFEVVPQTIGSGSFSIQIVGTQI